VPELLPPAKEPGMSKKTKKSEQGKTGICALCKKPKELRNSHIIPEFLYKPLYNSEHKIFRLSTDKRPKRSFEQKGLREPLLCGDCEKQFSVYETYVKAAIYGGTELEFLTNSPNGFEFRVDYRKFKLFELSILWRVGVSSLPEFKNARLGSHEKVLRQMLLEERPGDTDEYGCILTLPVSHRNIMDEFIHSMGNVKVKGIQCCGLILAGMCWFFLLSKNGVDEELVGLFLQSDGALRIRRGDFNTDGYLRRLAKDFYEKNTHLFGQLE
jgi:hypothetical protein